MHQVVDVTFRHSRGARHVHDRLLAAHAASLRAAVAEREAGGMSRKEAIVDVARAAGVPKRDVYNLVHTS